MRHNEGQGKVQHAPDIVRASTTEPISALRSTIGSLWSAGCAWPRDRLNPDAASRSVVDFDPRLVADAAECLSLGLQTRRARPKSFLRRPPRARRRPSEPSCYSSPGGVKRLCVVTEVIVLYAFLGVSRCNNTPFCAQAVADTCSNQDTCVRTKTRVAVVATCGCESQATCSRYIMLE